MRARLLMLMLFCAVGLQATAADAPAPGDSRAIMTGDQVVRILDETVDWYRTLGMQQQAATQPSDLLILYANRQTAEKVMALAFEIARANAELISSDAGAARENEEAASASPLTNIRKKLDDQRATLQAEIESARRLAEPDAQTRIATLQGQL